MMRWNQDKEYECKRNKLTTSSFQLFNAYPCLWVTILISFNLTTNALVTKPLSSLTRYPIHSFLHKPVSNIGRHATYNDKYNNQFYTKNLYKRNHGDRHLSSQLYGFFSRNKSNIEGDDNKRKSKRKKKEKSENENFSSLPLDEDNNDIVETDKLMIEFNSNTTKNETTNMNVTKNDDDSSEVMENVEIITSSSPTVVSANANVVGVSATNFLSDGPITTEEDNDDTKIKSTKKNIFSRLLRKKDTSKEAALPQRKEIVRDKKHMNRSVDMEETKDTSKSESKSKSKSITKKQKKRKKKQLLPKRFTTYVSIVMLLFLAGPVPKRFLLEDDDYSFRLQSPQRYALESFKSFKKTNDNDFNLKQDEDQDQDEEETSHDEWWKEKEQMKSNHQDLDLDETNKKKTVEPKPLPSTMLAQEENLPKTSTSSPIQSSTSFVASAVKKIGPSVVRIDTEIYASVRDDPMYFLNPFAQPDAEDDGSNESEDQLIRSGQGSGIIFSHHGLVLTNAHVVEGANRVYVTLTDGRKFVAEVTGSDEMVDIAVLKILEHAPWGGHSPWKNGSSPNPNNNNNNNNNNKSDEKDNSKKINQYLQSTTSTWKGEPLPVASLGDSNNLQVGEFVIAVGNPGGLDNTVTMGIVSSLKRSSEEIGLPSKKVTFIQTDAAVNPGNSGGPLVNEHGEIIGINTCIRANMEGIAFAIPINKAKEIMFDLAEGKNIQHGYIGVVMMTVTPDFARQNNLDPNSPVGIIPEVHGVMIERVLGQTPAAIEGGLRRLDVVLEIGGVTVKNAGEAANLVDSAKVGEDLEVKILRGGKEMVTTLKPADLAEKIRQKKQVMKRPSLGNGGNKGGGGGGGRIYVLPFPTP